MGAPATGSCRGFVAAGEAPHRRLGGDIEGSFLPPTSGDRGQSTYAILGCPATESWDVIRLDSYPRSPPSTVERRSVHTGGGRSRASSPGAGSLQREVVRSAQTLSEGDRRLLAAWAADCAEHVVWIFEDEASHDGRPRALIARARAFAAGELDTAEEIRRRFVGGVGAGEVRAPAALAAARAAGQAVAVCHMGAHALGAAGYAARAAGLAQPGLPEAVEDEIRWQLDRMSPEVRAALRGLPRVGENSSGPLGPGLLASGELGTIIRVLQDNLSQTDPGD